MTTENDLHEAIDALARVVRDMPNISNCTAFRLTISGHGADYAFEHIRYNDCDHHSVRNIKGEWVEFGRKQ